MTEEKAPVSSKNFSIVHELEKYRGSDGKIEFKLNWPNTGTAPQHWKQTSNPYLKRTPGVDGYEAISVIHNERGWGGLQYDGERACFNGSVNAPGDWCYAVGAWVPGMSGPKGPVKEVELWAKGDNQDWVLIMRQVVGRVLWCPPQVGLIKNPTDPSNPNYSILDKLESFRTEGKLELKLSWPNSDLTPQHWKQVSNPYIVRAAGVQGYEPIDCPHTSNLWNGLQYDGGRSVLSGSSRADAIEEWFYAVGSNVDFEGGIPGPENPVECVELHAKKGDDDWTLIMRQTVPVIVDGRPVWEKEAEFTSSPPRGIRSGGAAQSAGQRITNAKGFEVEAEDEAAAIGFLKKGFFFTICLGIVSPFVVLSTLFNRIGVSENYESIVRFFLKFVMIFLFLWPIAFVLGLGSSDRIKYAVGAWVIILLIAFTPWPQLVVTDMEWNTVDDFQSHRKWRWTFENILAVASLLLVVLQLIALSWRLVPATEANTSFFGFDLQPYLEFKNWVSGIFSIFNLDFDIDFDNLDWPQVKFWLAAIATLIWLFFFVGFGTMISLLLRRFNRGGVEAGYGGHRQPKFVTVMECLCLGQPFQMILEYFTPSDLVNNMSAVTRVRLSMYSVLYKTKAYRIIFTLLSEIFYIPIVSAFLSTFDCTQQGASEVYLQDIQPDRLCWVGTHSGESILAMILLPIYLATTMILAPLALADSDGLFVSKELDVRYASLYLLCDKCGRFMVLVATIFLSRWPWIALGANIIINCWLAYVTEKNKPCSMPWINVVLAVTFGGSAYCSACLLLDLTGIPWIPMGLLLAGWLMLLVIGGTRIYTISKSGRPSFRLLDPKGEVYADTEPFDDTSLLRGLKHRIHSITTFLQGKELKGFQVNYKVDYMVVSGPRHLGLQSVAGERITSTTIKLDSDEEVKLLVVETGGCEWRGINKMEIHTTKGRVHEAGEATAEGQRIAIKPDGNAPIKSFHGGTGGHLHNIGLVVENTY